MTIGERIKTEREQRGWSKVELAKRSGVSDRCIGHYELGQREPQYEAVKKIMKAMGFQMMFTKEGVEIDTSRSTISRKTRENGRMG